MACCATAHWLIAAGLVAATACTSGTPFAPSAIIRPNAAIVRVGEMQVFAVENAVVTEFTIASDAGPWARFVRVEPGAQGTNVIQLVGLEPTPSGYVYISAKIGVGKRPLVAAVSVR